MLFPFHDSNPIHRTPWVTYAIVAVNVVCFLAVHRATSEDQQALFYRRGFVPARIEQLVRPRPILVQIEPEAVRRFDHRLVRIPRRQLELPPEPRQIVFSLLSCMFLHGGWFHLIGNMWFLWLFGNNVEDRLGAIAFLLFYLLGGLLASACHWMTDPQSMTPVIGASGAVAAVLGAYAITWPHARVRTLVFLFVFITVVDLPAMLVLGAWFLGQLLEAQKALGDLGGMSGGVAWWAHVGGFVVGLILMPLLSAAVGNTPAAPPEDEHEEDTWGTPY